MAEKRMWMVRAGESAYLIEDFKRKGIIAIGWNEVGDLKEYTTPEEVKKLVMKTYVEYSIGKIHITASQINKFRFEFKKGDIAISYDPDLRVYLIGEILSDYEYNTNICEYYHVRKVQWKGEVDRDLLSTTTKNTLGAISTIFEINEDSKNEILSIFKSEEKKPEKVEPETEESEIAMKNIISNAKDEIRDDISKLDWEQVQDLVAGLLRAMGYKTTVSQRGPDMGKDIIASPDGFGLEEPRIKVQVKHRKGTMGASEIRSFIGGIRTGKGVYVSTGGFTKDAKHEAERSEKPVTLVDGGRLVEMIIEYYDNFDIETRALLPLKKFYWPLSL